MLTKVALFAQLSVIDETLELIDAADQQMSFEVHQVKTRENPENDARKLVVKRAYCLHGIRFRNGCLATAILQSRMPFLRFQGRWAKPTLMR
jgi:hypothetical protein